MVFFYHVSPVLVSEIRLYINDRTQAVNINGCPSSFIPLLFGVPQGSVLGPQFFTIYSSPIANIARKNGLQVHMYADDTQLYLFFDLNDDHYENDSRAKIESCIKDIKLWMTVNKLKLKFPWTISNICILIRITHDSSHEFARGQSGLLRGLWKYQYLSTLALFVMEVLRRTVKITYIINIFESYSNLIPIRKNLPPYLNKGFIEPPCSVVSLLPLLPLHSHPSNTSQPPQPYTQIYPPPHTHIPPTKAHPRLHPYLVK